MQTSGFWREASVPEASQFADGEHLYLNYIKEYHRPVDPRLERVASRFCAPFSRVCSLIMGTYASNIDLCALAENQRKGMQDPLEEEQEDEDERGQDPQWGGPLFRCARLLASLVAEQTLPRLQPRSAWRRRLSYGWIPHLGLIIYLLCDMFLCVNILHLHQHEINSMRLQRVRELMALHGPWQQVAVEWNPTALGDIRAILWSMAPANSSIVERPTVVVRHSEVPLSLVHFERLIVMRMEEIRRTLESYAGAKFLAGGFKPGCLYTILIANGLMLYLYTIWLYGCAQAHDIQSERDNIDLAREVRCVNARCERVVLTYLASNRVYASIVARHSASQRRKSTLTGAASYGSTNREAAALGILSRCRPRCSEADVSQQQRRARESSLTCQLRNFLQEAPGRQTTDEASASSDYQACRMLMQMLTCGALRPLNRSDLWLRCRQVAQAVLYVSVFTYSNCYGLGGFVFLYLDSRGGFDAGELAMQWVLSLGTLAIAYHCTITVLSYFDQAFLVSRVLNYVLECIRLNECEFEVYAGLLPVRRHSQQRSSIVCPQSCTAPTSGRREPELPAGRGGQQTPKTPVAPWYGGEHGNLGEQQARAALVERMNSNFLFVLITYKMFVAQFATFRSTQRGILLAATVLIFTLPTLARIHMPYLEGDSNFRLNVLALSLTYLLPLNAICVPMCFVRARCQQLLLALASLFAHVARVRQFTAGANGDSTSTSSRVYNEHAVTILLKELTNMSQTLSQFTIPSFGLEGSYPSLLRIHFWWGLLVISNLIHTQSDFLGSYTNDPIGVWCFRLLPSIGQHAR